MVAVDLQSTVWNKRPGSVAYATADKPCSKAREIIRAFKRRDATQGCGAAIQGLKPLAIISRRYAAR